MQNVEFHSLYSGSSGNCTYIKIGGNEILIDLGGSMNATAAALRELGTAPERIGAVFITHEHCDHIRGIISFKKRYGTPIHMTRAAASVCGFSTIEHERLFCMEYDGVGNGENVGLESFAACGGLRVTSFATPHDSRGSVGYIVEGAGVRLGVATDLGCLDRGVVEALLGCDAVVIESNFDYDMLSRGSYPMHLKQRIMSKYGHLSNSEGAALTAVLAASGTNHIMLAHLSENNNTPELAREAAEHALGERFLSARVVVAERFAVTRFYSA